MPTVPETTPSVEQEKTLINWKAPSRPYKEKGGQFLTVPMVIVILVGIILLLAGEWMLIAVIATVVFVYYAWSSVVPEVVDFSITTRGVRVVERLYPWEGMLRWWVGEKWGQKMLLIESPMVVVGRIIMPFNKENEEQISQLMEKYLLHEKPQDTWLDRAEKWMTEKFPLTDKV